MIKLKLITATFLIICLVACSKPNEASPETVEAFNHLAQAVAANNKATELINRSPAFAEMSQADADMLESLWSAALEEALKVDISVLNSEEPGFGDAFKAKFINGLKLSIDGLNKSDGASLLRGQLLMGEFGEELTAARANHG